MNYPQVKLLTDLLENDNLKIDKGINKHYGRTTK